MSETARNSSPAALTTATGPITRYHLPFDTDGGIASRASIGVIVLATDYTIEHEFRQLLDLPGVAFYHSRIAMDAQVTPQTLHAMKDRIPACAEVILPSTDLDVIAFGCTSASMVIGEEGVFEQIRSVRPNVACTTPVTAAFAAFDALEAKRIAVLTPYRDDVNQVVRSYIEGRGYDVAVMGSFNEEWDPTVARITTGSISDAAEQLVGLADDRCAVHLLHPPAPRFRSPGNRKPDRPPGNRIQSCHGLALPAARRRRRQAPRIRPAVYAVTE